MAGPYRSAAFGELAPHHCLFCGGAIAPSPAGPACSRCSLVATPHEPFAGTPACPRCSTALERSALAPRLVDGATMHECSACRGAFVRGPDWDLLSAEPTRAVETLAVPEAVGPRIFRSVRCPACARPMERVTFGAVSGVVIDVCPPHGAWFDEGALRGALVHGAEIARKARALEDAAGIDRWMELQQNLLREEAPVVERALDGAERALRARGTGGLYRDRQAAMRGLFGR
jgi:Zn-finger nucleic acid-binding protein